jgi:hypothetical protein
MALHNEACITFSCMVPRLEGFVGDDNSTTKWNEKLTGPAAQQTYQKKYDMILFVAAAKQIYYLCEIL